VVQVAARPRAPSPCGGDGLVVVVVTAGASRLAMAGGDRGQWRSASRPAVYAVGVGFGISFLFHLILYCGPHLLANVCRVSELWLTENNLFAVKVFGVRAFENHSWQTLCRDHSSLCRVDRAHNILPGNRSVG
jgi:hypothetical protein